MSQMQETRNAISQIAASPTSPYSSPKKTSPTDLLDISQKFGPDFSDLSTSLHPADWVAPRLVMPFSRELCGANLEFSEDGYRASRVRGCRQSVAIGSAPLPLGCLWAIRSPALSISRHLRWQIPTASHILLGAFGMIMG